MTEVSNERLAWCLIVAAVLHLAMLILKVPGEPLVTTAETQKHEPIEVEAYDNRRTVVQTSKAKEQLEKKNKARFAGEFDNRVEEEVQSGRLGRFEDGKLGQATPELPMDEKGEDGGDKMPSMRDLMSLGASPREFEGVKKGGQTLLNTDKVIYASFMNRLGDEIYDAWVSNVHEASAELARQGRKPESNSYLTTLKIVLDKGGEVVSIQVLKSCGIPEFDEAPKKAFWEREPFPNPPTQMFEEDGYARFTYDFTVQWHSSSFNIVPWGI